MRVKRNNGGKSAARPLTGESLSQLQQLKAMNLEVLGERLRRARLDKKISQRDLSSGLFTSAYLSSLELGKTRPTLSTLEQLAALLGKSTDYFLRPTSAQSLEDALDEEHSRALELRQALLSAQVYLEHAADEQVWQILQQLASALSRLDPTDQARYHYLLGRYYHLLGNLPKALSSLHEAQQQLHLASQGQGQGETALRYANASAEPDLPGLIEYELGDINASATPRQSMAALNHYTTGLETLTPNSTPTLRWKLLAGIAGCYRLLNDAEQAQTYFQKALEQASHTTLSQQAAHFYQRANALSEQGDFQRASLYYGRSMQLYEGASEQEILQRVCLSLAQLQLQAKEYEAARQVAELALKLSSASESGSTSGSGSGQEKGEGSRSGSERRGELKALVLLATIHQREGDLRGASSYLEQATRLREAEQEAGAGAGAGGDSPRSRASTGSQEQGLEGQYYQVAAELKAEQGEREAAEGYYQKAIETLEGLQGSGPGPGPGPGSGGEEVVAGRLLAEVYYSYGRRLKEWNETEKSLELMERAYHLSTGKGRGRS